MKERNASNKSQAVRINITLPLPESQSQSPANSSFAGCGQCGKADNPLLQHAGSTLLHAAQGAYTLEQMEAALEIIEVALRRYYDGK
jgi:hypothetical protein